MLLFAKEEEEEESPAAAASSSWLEEEEEAANDDDDNEPSSPDLLALTPIQPPESPIVASTNHNTNATTTNNNNNNKRNDDDSSSSSSSKRMNMETTTTTRRRRMSSKQQQEQQQPTKMKRTSIQQDENNKNNGGLHYSFFQHSHDDFDDDYAVQQPQSQYHFMVSNDDNTNHNNIKNNMDFAPRQQRQQQQHSPSIARVDERALLSPRRRQQRRRPLQIILDEKIRQQYRREEKKQNVKEGSSTNHAKDDENDNIHHLLPHEEIQRGSSRGSSSSRRRMQDDDRKEKETFFPSRTMMTTTTTKTIHQLVGKSRNSYCTSSSSPPEMMMMIVAHRKGKRIHDDATKGGRRRRDREECDTHDDDNEEEEEDDDDDDEFSPLTCPPSQPPVFGRMRIVGEENGNVGGIGTTTTTTTTSRESSEDGRTSRWRENDNDKDILVGNIHETIEEGGGGEVVVGVERIEERRKDYPEEDAKILVQEEDPTHIEEYTIDCKKWMESVHHSETDISWKGRKNTHPDNDDDDDDDPCQDVEDTDDTGRQQFNLPVVAAATILSRKMRNNPIQSTMISDKYKEEDGQPTNTIITNKKRRRGGVRGEATTLALAVEYSSSSQRIDPSHENFSIYHRGGKNIMQQQAAAIQHQGMKIRKAGPTILALEEYDETGEIDSYFENSMVAEERKRRLRALAICEENEEQEENGEKEQEHDKEENTDENDKDNLAVQVEQEKQSTFSEAAFVSNTELVPAIIDNDNNVAEVSMKQRQEQSSRTIHEMLCDLKQEFDEMGKALICPICQSTLKNAIILPCVHAFCKACLKEYYNPPQPCHRNTKKRKGGNDGRRVEEGATSSSSSPRRKPKAECPVCKTANPGKRSGEAAPHLDELARAYKLMMRGFSLAPVKYCKNVPMTQLDPQEEEVEDEEGNKNDEEEVGNTIHRLIEEEEDGNDDTNYDNKDIESKIQHLQVAKAVRDAFVEQSKIILQSSQHSRPIIGFKEKLKVQRYQHMAKEQEAVVRADEQVLMSRGVGNGVVRGMKQMITAVKTVLTRKSECTIGTCTKESPPEVDKDGGKDVVSSPVKCQEISKKSMVEQKAMVASDTTATASNHYHRTEEECVSLRDSVSKEIENSAAHHEDSISFDEDDIFFSSREESQSKYSTKGEDALFSSSCPNITVIHDGHTAKKTYQCQVSSQDNNCSNRQGRLFGDLECRSNHFLYENHESIAAESTSYCSPIVFHDGNTARKFPNEAKSSHHSPLFAAHSNDGPVSRSPDKTVSLAEKRLIDDESLRGEAHSTQIISVGSIVYIQARTWPGINKPGGVARVIKIHPASCHGDSTKYDVAYVLGGKEKGVDESFVSINGTEELSITKESLDNDMRTPGQRYHDMKNRHRRAVLKFEPKISSREPSFPIYNDEELKHIPDDVLKWAGILPKKVNAPPIKKALNRVKRVLMQSNAVPKSQPMKKCKISTHVEHREASVRKYESPNQENKSLIEVLRSLSVKDIVTHADARYSSLLSTFQNESSTSMSRPTLHAVTSNLSDNELKLLDSFRLFLKGKSVILKVNKEFIPNKTLLCITSSEAFSRSTSTANDPFDIVSSSRTLKVMQATLAGIPILTPAWMAACLKDGHLVTPTGPMCIRSLPQKNSNTRTSYVKRPNAQFFGVAKYAAAFERANLSPTNHVLSGFSVLLCNGSAESELTKDLTVLLKQAGAIILKSSSEACRMLTEISCGKVTTGSFVILCGDSLSDETSCCDISDSLFQQVRKLFEGNNSGGSSASVFCVAHHWLFDSIGCAVPMKSNEYKPATPRARALWEYINSNSTPGENMNVN